MAENPSLKRRHLSTQKGGGAEEDQEETASSSISRAKYFLNFESGDEQKNAIKRVSDHLQDNGLKCQLTEDGMGIIVSASLERLLAQAEKEQWKIPLKDIDELMKFKVDEAGKFKPCEAGHLFSSAEEVRLLYFAIESTPFTSEQFADLQFKLEEDHGFLTALLHSEMVAEAYPLHSEEEKKRLSRMFHLSFIPLKGVNVDDIRNYFGETVAFYFAWMNFYTTFAIIPALIGLAMYSLRPSGVTVDDDAFLPFFSVIMSLWGVFFLVIWQRRSAVHSFKWNTYSHSDSSELRREFHGVVHPDPVTGKPTLYYPGWKRRMWYIFSFLVMIPLLSLGVITMTLSLNLNGYVTSKESPIYVERLANFAQPGGLFAADSPYYLWLVPTLGHTIVITIINTIYSSLAEKCTNLENHRIRSEWHSSLVIKRVAFECFDCFMPLFYIAFYQLDVVTLRAEIMSLFISDEIRRVTMETVIPFVKALFVTRVAKKTSVKDAVFAEYEQFDDYLEMVIQFGYITLFAASFPLGAAITLLFLYVELRSDVFKLLTSYRRPHPLRANNIGVWFDVMKIMVFTAILTNCFILGFSSEQLMQWMPWLFTRDQVDGDQMLRVGSGRYVVGVVFGFEHAMLLISLFLMKSINPVPKWVRTAIARRKYNAKQRLQAAAATSTQAERSKAKED